LTVGIARRGLGRIQTALRTALPEPFFISRFNLFFGPYQTLSVFGTMTTDRKCAGLCHKAEASCHMSLMRAIWICADHTLHFGYFWLIAIYSYGLDDVLLVCTWV
jgi:hypothetical protein